jgi:hypothetical protein
MFKPISITLIGSLLIVLPSTCVAAGVDCTSTSAAIGCAKQTQRISEQPSGAVDGKNAVFSLSKLPINEKNIRVFVNGLELLFGSGFQANGQTITIASGSIPRSGDLVRVSYETSLPNNQHLTRSAAITDDRTVTLVNQTLLEALLREEIPGSAPIATNSTPGTSDPIVTRSSKTRVQAVKQRSTESLSLLSRRIEDEVRSTHPSKKVQRERVEEQDTPLNGFEGTGDLPLPSPYSTVLGTNTEKSTQNTSTSTTGRGAVAAPRLRSISMLQQSLDSADKKEQQKQVTPGDK